MTHSDIQSRMARYLDGDLSLDARALFDAHLDQCAMCSRELFEMRDTIRLLRTLPSEEPPVNFVNDVMARIAAGEGSRNFWGRVADQISHYLIPRIAIPIGAVAAALTLTVMSGDLGLEILNTEKQTSGLEMAGVTLNSDPEAKAPLMPSGLRVGSVVAPTRVATVTAEARLRQAESIRVSNAVRNALTAEQNPQGSAGSFLFRLANDRNSVDALGPIRRLPSERDIASRILFTGAGAASHPVPYLGASAVPSIGLGASTYLVSGSGVSGRPQGSGALTPVAVSRLNPNAVQGTEELSADDLRNRELDARLRFLEIDPTGFAERQAGLKLAEQELWMREMAVRAEELGNVERVLRALEGSGESASSELARAFESAVLRYRESWAANEASQVSE